MRSESGWSMLVNSYRPGFVGGGNKVPSMTAERQREAPNSGSAIMWHRVRMIENRSMSSLGIQTCKYLTEVRYMMLYHVVSGSEIFPVLEGDLVPTLSRLFHGTYCDDARWRMSRRRYTEEESLALGYGRILSSRGFPGGLTL